MNDPAERLITMRDDLLRRRETLMACFDGVKSQIKEVDVKLADLHAAARVFSLDWGVETKPFGPSSSVKEAVIGCLEAAGTEGSRVREMRPIVERELAKTLHPKTLGMTLFRLKHDGLTIRDPHSHVWKLAKFCDPQATVS